MVNEGKNAVKWTKPSCRRFKDNAARLQLFALAYNLANFLRQLVLPMSIKGWTLTTLRESLVKIGTKVVSHSKYVTFQRAEVAVPCQLVAALLERIARLRLVCGSGRGSRRWTRRSGRRPGGFEVRLPGRFRGRSKGEGPCGPGSGRDGAGAGGASWGKIVAIAPPRATMPAGVAADAPGGAHLGKRGAIEADDDPLLQLQRRVQERLGKWFSYNRSVSSAYRGK
jgi:hypothetical protein